MAIVSIRKKANEAANTPFTRPLCIYVVGLTLGVRWANPRQVRRMKRIFNPRTTLDSMRGFRKFLIRMHVCPSTLTSVGSKGTTLFPYSVLSKMDED